MRSPKERTKKSVTQPLSNSHHHVTGNRHLHQYRITQKYRSKCRQLRSCANLEPQSLSQFGVPLLRFHEQVGKRVRHFERFSLPRWPVSQHIHRLSVRFVSVKHRHGSRKCCRHPSRRRTSPQLDSSIRILSPRGTRVPTEKKISRQLVESHQLEEVK